MNNTIDPIPASDLGYTAFASGRHIVDAPTSHSTLSEADKIALGAAGTFEPGDRDGVVLSTVDPTSWYTPEVELQEGDRIVGLWAKRAEDEKPRFSVYVDRGGNKTPATTVQLVIYARELLGAHATGDAPHQVVSENATGPSGGPSPISSSAHVANYFVLDGGTERPDMTATQFLDQLAVSLTYESKYGMAATRSVLDNPDLIDLGTYVPGRTFMSEEYAAHVFNALEAEESLHDYQRDAIFDQIVTVAP